MGARSKCGGMTGRLAKLHLPRFTSNSSGALISTRWPTADVTMCVSFSKYSAAFSNLPTTGVNARTMSCATDGFSAMISVLLICLSVPAKGSAPMHQYNPGFSRAYTYARAPTNSMYPKKSMTQASAAKTPRPDAAKAPASPSGRRIQVRRSGVHGKGVFAVAPIAKGEIVIEYKGEVISWPEALRRHPHDPK